MNKWLAGPVTTSRFVLGLVAFVAFVFGGLVASTCH